MPRILLLVLTSIIFSYCQSKNETRIKENIGKVATLDYDEISRKIVVQADLQPGEKVLLVIKPGEFNPIIGYLADRLEASGAFYLGTLSTTNIQPKGWSTKFIENCIKSEADELEKLLEEVDLGIMLPGASPSDLVYKILQEQLEEGIRRTIHFHWAGAYDLNGNLLEINREKGLFYQSVILETDYKELGEHQLGFEEAMRNQNVRVTTPDGTDLSFRIGDRPVTKQDGNASAERTKKAKNLIDREIEIPSGAIRVAPIEESVHGKIAFPDADWNGTRVEGLVVTISKGKISHVEARQGADAARNEMENAGEGGKSFREFALGFNPLMTVQSGDQPWIPYYGYGAGVVRLSLGDNTELGGKVGGSYVRWNFFTNATVKVGEDIWVENGKLIR